MQTYETTNRMRLEGRGTQMHANQPAIRDRLTWSRFAEASQVLARQVVASGYEPNLILAIARGGLAPAAAIAYRLDVKQVATINVRYYVGVLRHLRRPVLLPPLFDRGELRGERVLIVDDVADSGATLCLVKNLCRHEAAEVRSAVIYEKPASLIRSEYVWRRTLAWVEFPWEYADDSTRRG